MSKGKKVSIIGAGNVGATVAYALAMKGVCHEIVLRDRNVEIAKGKALDMSQAANAARMHTLVSVAEEASDMAGSDVVVITAGSPRLPGMSRDDLLMINAEITREVVRDVKEHAPDAIIIMVSNPLDVMTYAAHKASGKAANKVFGMAGVLDTARYRAFLATELNVSPNDIQALLMGGHGDTMVPLPRFTTVAGIPVTTLVKKERLDEIIDRTKKGGGEIVKLLGTSAWYAPGAAAAQMVESIVNDQKHIFPVCVQLNGEWGQKDVYLGSPVRLGREGIEEIIEVELNEEEMADMETSSKAVKSVMDVFDGLNLM